MDKEDREQLIKEDADDLWDWQKSILLVLDKQPKTKLFQINDNFKNLIHPEDIYNFIDAMCQEGILYKNHGYYCLTNYGKDLVKEIRHQLIISKHNNWKKLRTDIDNAMKDYKLKSKGN